MQPKFLNRYTTLPVLIDMLWRRQIALLSPQSWEDRNDAYYLERYQQEKALGSVLALCFSTKRETFHHWRVFSQGASGVCIEFGAERFLTSVRAKPELKHGLVEYARIDKLECRPPKVDRWPFLKRLPYADEAEYRVICESAIVGELARPLDFDIGAVQRVTLSPWMPKPVADSVVALIKTIPGCADIYAHRSSLIENGRWKKALKTPTPRSASPTSKRHSPAPARGKR